MGHDLSNMWERPMLQSLFHRGKIICLVCLFFACSGRNSEEPVTVESLENDQTTLINKELATGQRNTLSHCKSDQGEGWMSHTKSLKLCSFPTVIYQCKSTFDQEGMGAQVKWAILKSSPSEKSLAAMQVLWEGVIATEEIPNAHAERIYSRTRLKPSNDPIQEGSCRPFIAIREQQARSFNQVDARESEFDESSTDEVTFEYDQSLMRYVKVAEEVEPEIKVRSR